MVMKKSGAKVENSLLGRLQFYYSAGRIAVVDDEGNTIAHLGVRPDGSVGFDFAPQGTDVFTADLGDLIASSRLQGFTIAEQGTVIVTREAGTESGVAQVSVASMGAPMFLAVCRYSPAVSPNLSFGLPHITYNTSGADSGKITKQRRMAYDPDIGVLKFYVESTSIDGLNGIEESWEFQYFILYQNLPS